ncbi:MAG: PEP-CTERM sorting domain-containing protein, partial [Verrucomicrobia bacterium]|nr:PEP-CTERM sorting domain-containing protein [Verrucomicrobiota bacterium]
CAACESRSAPQRGHATLRRTLRVNGLRHLSSVFCLLTSVFVLLLSSSTASAAVIMLTHADGTDGSTTLTDEAGNFNFSAVAQAQLDTSQSKFGTASMLFDGTDDGFTTPDSDLLSFGNNDWTIDFWARANAWGSTTTDNVTGQLDPAIGTSSRSIFVYFPEPSVGAGHNLRFAVYDDSTTRYDSNAGTTDLAADEWYHIAVVRNGPTITGYVDGMAEATINIGPASLQNGSGVWAIGRSGSYTTGGSEFNGWVDEYRIVDEEAAWTSNFTPPTEAYGSGGGEGPSGAAPEPGSLALIGVGAGLMSALRKRKEK